MVYEVDRFGEGRRGQVAGVRPLHRDDPRVGAERLCELSAAHVESVDRSAPRCNRTSVKPPVEAPTSSATSPVGSMSKASSAAASLWPPRLTYGSGANDADGVWLLGR